MIEIHGQDLGIEDCFFNARGETAEDVMEAMFEHLRQDHDLDMPPVEEVLGDKPVPQEALDLRRGAVVDPGFPADEGVRLVIQRCLERLDLTE